MVKRYFYILGILFLTTMYTSCEDDPILEDTSTGDDNGSYGKLRIDNDTNKSADSEKQEENHEVF